MAVIASRPSPSRPSPSRPSPRRPCQLEQDWGAGDVYYNEDLSFGRRGQGTWYQSDRHGKEQDCKEHAKVYARCGVAVPVHPEPRGAGGDGTEFAYFRICPLCGGRTGLYAYWASSPAARELEGTPAE